VYSERIIPHRTAEDECSSEGADNWLAKFFQKVQCPPTTRAARLWVFVKHWVRDRLQGELRKSDEEPASFWTKDVCVFATGPAGCSVSGRKILHIAQGMGQSVKTTITKIDTAIDSFVDSLEGDEDEDVLDKLLRMLDKAGRMLGKGGRSLARRGTQFAKKVIRKARRARRS
jgi:hypothetical protein